MSPSSPVEQLRAQFAGELATASSDADVKVLRDRYLGRKGGAVAALLKEVAGVPADERPILGRQANELKREIETALDEKRAALEASRAPMGSMDVTLPGRRPAIGRTHPLTALRSRIEDIFARQGYEILDGPETEDDWHNFEALNMPPEHPARDMQDTLYLEAAVVAGTRATGEAAARLHPRRACHAPAHAHVGDADPLHGDATSRRCASSRPAASIAATTSTSPIPRCSSRSKGSSSAKA